MALPPTLTLSYSSQSTNERYSQRAPAGNEGDGFSLSLGSITAVQYPAGSTDGAGTWYMLNGIDGISDRLVPSTTAGSYETEHISHLSIQFTSGYWQIHDLDGTYYQLGNTTDSTQKTAAGTYEWDVNKILAPYNSSSQVKTMLISYLQDSPDSGTTIRSAGLKQILYGYATSTSATSLALTAGTVDFHYHMPSVPAGQTSWATAYGSNYNCASSPPSSTTLRCDDPVTFNSVPAPPVMTTLSLDSVTSYVGSDSTGNAATKYAFTYQDTPYGTSYSDPYTQVQQASAGEHLLTQITPTVYVQGAAKTRKGVVFGYTGSEGDYYNDPSHTHSSGNGTYGGLTFWNYLNFYEDLTTGEGALVTYARAYGNPHGTPYVTDGNGNVIDDRMDPLYCTNQANNPDTSKQCNGQWSNTSDYSWTMEVVTQIMSLGTDSSGDPTRYTTNYQYALAPVPASATPTGSCNPITGAGVPAQEAYCVADNWVTGYDGTQNQHKDGDWADYYHAEYRGFNMVYTTSSAGDLTVDAYFSVEGWWYPESNGTNYNGGQRYLQDVYQGDVATPAALLQETRTDFAGVGTTPVDNPYGGINTCNGLENAIYNPCVIAPLLTKTIEYEGQGGSSSAPWTQTVYSYDDINPSVGYVAGHYHNTTQEVISSSNAATLTKKWTYTSTSGSYGGLVYYNVNKVTHSEIDDSSGHVWSCQDTTYDEGNTSGAPSPVAGWPTTVKAYSTCGNSSTALSTYSGYDAYGNTVASVDAVGAAHPSFYSSGGCTLSTAPVILATAWTAGRYTSCSTYDTSVTANLPLTQKNALSQTTSTSYDSTTALLPNSTVDLNGQTTNLSESLDGSGNQTLSLKDPGETGSYTSQSSENSQCTSSSTLPCYEIDGVKSLYSSAVSRTFFDAMGRKIETRTAGPIAGDDTVVMTVYDDGLHTIWTSEPFLVSNTDYGTGWIDPSAVNDINGNSPGGSMTFYDALGRVVATQDINYDLHLEPGIACSAVLSGMFTTCTNYSFAMPNGVSTVYAEASMVDANGHVTQQFTDGLNRTVYTQTNSGLFSGTLTVQQQTQAQYNVLNKPNSVAVVDEQPQSGQSLTTVTTTATYDDPGRQLTQVDPDQGTLTASYDPNGHPLSLVQTSGSSTRTLGFNYDLLERTGCEQTAAATINSTGACTAGNPLVQNTYDTTFLGTAGTTDFPVGQLTKSVATTYFPDATSATVTQESQHDTRGRAITEQQQVSVPSGWSVSTAIPTYQVSMLYNDADQVTTTSANAGTGQSYTFTTVYDSTTGAITGLSNNGASTANLAQLSYSEFAQLSSLTLLNGAATSPASIASESFSYDGNLRPTSLSASWLPGSGNSGTLLGQGISYDTASNVKGSTTTYAAVPGQSGSGGSETQNFCYDEQNRLFWSGNSGTQPSAGNGTCGSGTLSNSLSGANYTDPYTYTNLGQTWQGPLNGSGSSEQYLYCDSSHPHQLSGLYPTGTTCATRGGATAVYTATYDAWGNESGRVYNSVTATLSYDQLNRLVNWNAGANSQEWYVYDAGGNRVLKRSISGGSTTLTGYAFGLQELDYSGAGTPTAQVDYYALAGHLIGSFNGTSLSYDLTSAQGSVLMSLSSTAVQGEQDYGPYGNKRYSRGTISTAKGYTGQVADPVTGLDYYNARYYDPVVGVFMSPDSKQGNPQAMDPYNYVGGNPETRVDPTGQRIVGPVDGGGGSAEPVVDASGNHKTVVFDKPGSLPQVISPTDRSSTSQMFSHPKTGFLAYKTTKAKSTRSGQSQASCDDKCQRETEASNLAKEAASYFQSVVDFFHNLANAPWWLNLISLFGYAVVQAISGALADIASVYARGFAQEASKLLSWFDGYNVDQQAQQMDGEAAQVSADDVLIGLGLVVLSVVLDVVVDAMDIAGYESLGRSIAGLVSVGPGGAVVGTAVIWIGSFVFEEQADSYQGQQEEAVSIF